MFGIQLSNHRKKKQLRRGISQNNTEVLQSATILYWYFFSNHDRHALPLLLISICNIGNNIVKEKIWERQTDEQESQWKPLFVGFSFVFYLCFEHNSEWMDSACCHTSCTLIMMYAKYLDNVIYKYPKSLNSFQADVFYSDLPSTSLMVEVPMLHIHTFYSFFYLKKPSFHPLFDFPF